MQTLHALVVCLYVFNTAAAAEPTTTAATPKPKLACDSSGNLTYTGIPNWVLSATTDCGKAVVNTDSLTVVITRCPIGSKATVHMYRHATPSPDPKIVTSRTVILTCIAADGTYKADFTFPGSYSVSPSMVTAKEPLSLTMTLTDHNTNQPATSVVIGNLYDLLITGAGNHFMKLVNCIAAANAASVKSKTNLVTVFVADDSGNDPGVISPLTDTPASGADTHPLKATLTGFRLVESLTVYLECSVNVCDTKGCLPAHKQKRTKSSLKTASLKFEVVSTQSPRHANGARDINTSGKFTLTFAMVILARYITFK